jgi:ACR3 family arsenite efflux pump ArsB
LEIARVHIPVGLLIWVMIVPMLLKIDFGRCAGSRSIGKESA